MRTQRGFARADVLAALACAIVIIALASFTLAQQGKGIRTSSKTMKDASQLRGIHQSWLVFAREFEGKFPTPGLMDRLPFNGAEVPGRGEEDITQNTTANLHAACIMYNYYTAELVISPVERSPHVKAAADYNYEMYNPAEDSYWDPEFKADLAKESNVSYANLVLSGKPKAEQWRETLDPHYAVVGNRGPKNGAMDTSSITCGPHGNWAGNIVFQDNHAKFLTETSVNVAGEDEAKKLDNLFASDKTESASDILLSFTRKMTEDGPELQWD